MVPQKTTLRAQAERESHSAKPRQNLRHSNRGFSRGRQRHLCRKGLFVCTVRNKVCTVGYNELPGQPPAHPQKTSDHWSETRWGCNQVRLHACNRLQPPCQNTAFIVHWPGASGASCVRDSEGGGVWPP